MGRPRNVAFHAAPHEFAGTERFEVRRRLGSGSFGVVYEGWDKERNASVAIKWLQRVEANTIHRFKQEFRSLTDVSHPNLVQLYDLACVGDRWFFTMELVHGVPLPEYLRPEGMVEVLPTLGRPTSQIMSLPRQLAAPAAASPPSGRRPMDVQPEDVLRVFRQLAQGVHALHAASKLHRDLKCQNVMVTPDGRVVLLDFGLVREVRPSRWENLPAGSELEGTPLYMAPEQCAGRPIDEAADWYAVGVMLFRALTSEFPFRGRALSVLAKKQIVDAPRASELVFNIPPDLDELTARLLSRKASDRPRGEDILNALGAGELASAPYRRDEHDVFIGRRRQLRLLDHARKKSKAGIGVVVYAHGPSGVGKTALVHHYLERLHEEEPDTWIVKGRCYARERLPYKALDAVVDAIANRLCRRPDPEIERLTPPYVEDLVRAFPALARVGVFGRAAAVLSEPPDPQERRRRATAALAGLLQRLAQHYSLVVFIDDLQWGDPDSAVLLRSLFRGQDAPPIMWVGTYRREEASTSPLLRALGVPEAISDREILLPVDPLSEDESRALVESRLSAASMRDPSLEALVGQAGGSPLLIDLWVRHHAEPVAGDVQSPSALRDVIARTVGDVGAHGREVIEVLAVRGQPLSVAEVAAALGESRVDLTTLTQLVNARLVRLRTGQERETVELYHGKIGETVAASLSPETERARHLGLVRALFKNPEADPESLAYHHAGAGQLAPAFALTVQAAWRAEDALAFDRAADLFRSALDLHRALKRAPQPQGEPAPSAPADEPSLRVALADALRNAGRGVAAARAYLQAARVSATAEQTVELERRAAEQYLFSGHLERGRTLLRRVLAEVGLAMPQHQTRVLAEFLLRRAQVSLRGLSFEPQSAATLPESARLQIDVCWSVSVGFAMIDPLRGGIFQAIHLLLALRAGELSRVARALAVEIPFSATQGIRSQVRTRRLMAEGKRLAEQEASPYTRGLLKSATGGAYWLEGNWYEACECEERALAILRGECSGVAWQIASSSLVLLDSMWRMGRWKNVLHRVESLTADAQLRGDLLLEIYLRVKFGALSLWRKDRPEAAVQEAQRAMTRWSQQDFQLLHFWELYLRVEVALYRRQGGEARAILRTNLARLRASGLLQLDMYAVTYRDLSARVNVAAALETDGKQRARRLSEASAEVKRVESNLAGWARALGHAGRASIAAASGDPQAAQHHLARAQTGFQAAHMSLHALAVRLRSAELRGDDAQRKQLLAEVRAEAGGQPRRWMDVWLPGLW